MRIPKKYRLLMSLLAFSIFLIYSYFQSRHQTNIIPVSPIPTKAPQVQGVATVSSILVSKVIDGDTIELTTGEKVRYIGIDTPETRDPRRGLQCFGREATAKNKELVEGKTVRLVKDISETDKYGRLLRYLYIGNVFVNEYLVREGYAYASSYPPDVSQQELLQAAQQDAQAHNRGLWKSCNTQL